MGLSLLVTVGSTLFSDLTDLVVSPTFLQLATRLGLTDIVVQYGAADLTFPPDAKHITIGIVGKARSEAGKGSGEGSFEYTAGTHEASGRPMNALVDGPEQEIVQGMIRVRYMRYTSEFDKEVKRADMVISHAGSGSILSALRANKPLLVIPNNSLMDDHQTELARALQAEGYMAVSSIDNLSAVFPAFIERAKSHLFHAYKHPNTATGDAMQDGNGFTPFPPVARGRFASILDNVAGFSP